MAGIARKLSPWTGIVLVALAFAAPAGARLDLGDGGAASRTLVAPRVDVRSAVVAAASDVAGRPVTIACETADAVRATVGWALAYVVIDGSSVIHLGPWACEAIRDASSPLFGEGVLVVLHEAEHLAGRIDESAATCAALDVMPSILRARLPFVDGPVTFANAKYLLRLLPDDYTRC